MDRKRSVHVTSDGVRFVDADDLLSSDTVKALIVKMDQLRQATVDSRRGPNSTLAAARPKQAPSLTLTK